MRGQIRRAARGLVRRVLARRGYVLWRAGEGYLDAKQTLREARRAGLSLHEYIYRNENAHKAGRTDRIVAKIAELLGDRPISVAEIGTGTGMYLERMCRRLDCTAYHVFETDVGWRRHARQTLSQVGTVTVHDCDGSTLKELLDDSIDLVHAHGVFVYLPTLVVLSYLREAARVLKPQRYLVFDCFLDTKFNPAAADAWLASEYRFPNVMSSAFLSEHLQHCGLSITRGFDEVLGPAACNYLICRKVSLAKEWVSR